MKEYLGFSEGMMVGISKDHTNKSTHKVFDWIKAAKLIKNHCSIGDCFDANKTVSAGLKEDWGYTSGEIFNEGSIVEEDDTYTYLFSSWATPILDIDGEEYECFVNPEESDYEWESDTFWPEEAIEELNKK